MFTIQKVLLQEKHFTLEIPFTTANSTHTVKRILFAEIYTTCGKVIQSECAAGDWPGYSEETVESAKETLELHLIPAILDQPFEHPSDVHEVLLACAPDAPLARATLEMGAWAIAAQCMDLSLDEYFGGKTRLVAVGKTLGMMPIDALIKNIRKAEEEGYQRVKIKLTSETALVTLEIISKKCRRNIPIIVDFNGSLSQRDVPLLKELDRYRLMMIEQPFPRDEWKLSSDTQRTLKTPICFDESIRSLEDLDKMIKMKAAKIVTLKPACLGGFTVALDIADACRLNHIPMWVGGMLESTVGKTYLSAFATIEGMTFPGDVVTTLIA